MITIDKTYQVELLKYFSKNDYDTKKKLEELDCTSVSIDVRNFLLDLTFENNGLLSQSVLFSENSNNTKIRT